VPHLSSECLKAIGKNDKIVWPSYDKKQLEESSSLIVIQINGKKRGLINTKLDSSEDEIMELVNKNEKILKYLIGNNIKKRIYIKNKLINIII
jgi:leucyl-tRNA synthetase